MKPRNPTQRKVPHAGQGDQAIVMIHLTVIQKKVAQVGQLDPVHPTYTEHNVVIVARMCQIWQTRCETSEMMEIL